jgi:hypothetical protein
MMLPYYLLIPLPPVCFSDKPHYVIVTDITSLSSFSKEYCFPSLKSLLAQKRGCTTARTVLICSGERYLNGNGIFDLNENSVHLNESQIFSRSVATPLFARVDLST